MRARPVGFADVAGQQQDLAGTARGSTISLDALAACAAGSAAHPSPRTIDVQSGRCRRSEVAPAGGLFGRSGCEEEAKGLAYFGHTWPLAATTVVGLVV